MGKQKSLISLKLQYKRSGEGQNKSAEGESVKGKILNRNLYIMVSKKKSPLKWSLIIFN